MRSALVLLGCLSSLAACGVGRDAAEAGDPAVDDDASGNAELSTSLTVSPATTSLSAPGTATARLSTTSAGTWVVTISSLSAGAVATLSSKSLTSNAPVTISFSASGTAPTGTQSFTVKATKSGATTKTTTGALRITAAGGGTGGGTGGGSGQNTKRVLFDAAHNQVVGNADWVLDSHAPDPQPANPTSETSWSGGISAWGVALVKSGRYSVAQLPAGSALTWGGGGPGDLKNFDVFVSDEPETNFSSAEQLALMAFARAGGGLFLASDHAGASRCSSCTEAWRVINHFLVSGAAAGSFGAQVDGNNLGTVTGTATGAPFTDGPFGHASQLSYHSGSSVSATGANAHVVVVANGKGLVVASQLDGGGRLVLLGDSSPLEDGTCQCSAHLHNGWAEAGNAALLLNATAWLANDS